MALQGLIVFILFQVARWSAFSPCSFEVKSLHNTIYFDLYILLDATADSSASQPVGRDTEVEASESGSYANLLASLRKKEVFNHCYRGFLFIRNLKWGCQLRLELKKIHPGMAIWRLVLIDH